MSPIECGGCFAGVLRVGGVLLEASGLLGNLELGAYAGALQARLCNASRELHAILRSQLCCDGHILCSAQVVCQAQREL